MKNLTFILIIFSNLYSQKLPDLGLLASIKDDYLCLINLSQTESKSINNDFLFASKIRDSISTDSILLSFHQILKISIKKISLSKNGIDYFTINTFLKKDSLTCTLVDKNRYDTLLFLDSMLTLKTQKTNSILKFKINKNVVINKNDTFKIILDVIPQKNIQHSISHQNFKKSTKICHNSLFSLSGRKLFDDKLSWQILIPTNKH